MGAWLGFLDGYCVFVQELLFLKKPKTPKPQNPVVIIFQDLNKISHFLLSLSASFALLSEVSYSAASGSFFSSFASAYYGSSFFSYSAFYSSSYFYYSSAAAFSGLYFDSFNSSGKSIIKCYFAKYILD